MFTSSIRNASSCCSSFYASSSLSPNAGRDMDLFGWLIAYCNCFNHNCPVLRSQIILHLGVFKLDFLLPPYLILLLFPHSTKGRAQCRWQQWAVRNKQSCVTVATSLVWSLSLLSLSLSPLSRSPLLSVLSSFSLFLFHKVKSIYSMKEFLCE